MKKKLKILHLADHLSGKSDGIFTLLIILINKLNNYEHILGHPGAEFLDNEFKRVGGSTFIIQSITKKIPIKAAFQLFKYIRQNDIDIIHCHFLKPYVIAGFCNIFLRRKVIYNFHGIFIDNVYYNQLEKIIYRIAHLIICKLHGVQLAVAPSVSSKNILLGETKLFPEVKEYYKCSSIQFKEDGCIDTSLVEKIKDEKEFKILVVSRVERQKRIDLLLELASMLVENKIKFKIFIIGDGVETDKMKKYAVDLKVHNYCYFLGYIKNPFQYFDLFDVLLFTSDWEGLPLTIFEAMEKGLPVISTDVSGISEIVIHNKTGLLYPRGDMNAAFDAIKNVIENPDLLKKYSSESKKLLCEKFSCDNTAARFNEIYSGLYK